jgi:hypothetical protein
MAQRVRGALWRCVLAVSAVNPERASRLALLQSVHEVLVSFELG